MLENYLGEISSKPTAVAKLATVIACDQAPVLTMLKQMLAAVNTVEVVAECRSGGDALCASLEHEPDLIFLDESMPGLNTLSLLKRIEPLSSRVILVNSTRKNGVRALDLHAVDFVVKPLDGACLETTLDHEHERRKFGLSNAASVATRICDKKCGHESRALEALEAKGAPVNDGTRDRLRRKLSIRDSGMVKVVPFDDIDFVEAAGDYMCVHARGETLVMRSTLRDLMKKLEGGNFARIHRSTIVNIEKIVSLMPLPKGAGLVQISAGKKLKVSRNYRDSVRNLFQ